MFLRNAHLLLLINCVLATGKAAPLVAQEKTQAPPTEALNSDQVQDLTQGLLDLLKELPPNGTATPTPNMPNKSGANASQNSGTGIPEGEDLGQAAANPLSEIQLGMSTLAQWLRGAPDVAKTQGLQRDIVLRLDDLIGQLEKQTQQPNSSNSNSQTQTSEQSQADSTTSKEPVANQATRRSIDQPGTRSNPSDRSSANSPVQGRKAADAGNNPSPGGAQTGEGQPGVSPLRQRNATVELNDPTALQRSAWGNLPDRVREQMQSRMVERFLPGYREEIEAYFRALAK